MLSSLIDIEISLAAGDITCWESVHCPYCMIKQLKKRVEEDLNDES